MTYEQRRRFEIMQKEIDEVRALNPGGDSDVRCPILQGQELCAANLQQLQSNCLRCVCVRVCPGWDGILGR